MEDYICEICFLDFDDQEVIPKVLECGHSFCSSCISDLLERMKKCPKCSHLMTKHQKDLYPTNYSLQNIIKGLQHLKVEHAHLKEQYKHLNILKVLKKELKDKSENLMAEIEERKVLLSRINKSLLKISEIMDSENISNDTQLKEIMDEVTNFNSVPSSNFGLLKSDMSIIFPDNFNSFGEFLNMVYGEVQKGEDVFVTDTIQGKIKYGKITTWNKMLLVHSLTLSFIKRGAKIVQLQDLKSGITKHNFRIFLKLPLDENGATYTTLVKMVDSLLGPRFIKLCTGENGASYKGAPFTKGLYRKTWEPILEVKAESFLVDNENETAPHDYDIKSSEMKAYSGGAILVERYEDGGFRIYKSLQNEYWALNIVGRVVSNENMICKLFYGGEKKVLDSGIAFYV